MTISFFVPGTPMPWPRAIPVRVGDFVRVVAKGDKRYRRWRESIRAGALDAGVPCLAGAASVTLGVLLDPPKSLKTKLGGWRKNARSSPTGARDGDVDNYAKAVLDSLNGVAWGDDCQVVSLSTSKRWTKPGEVSGVYVTVEES